MGALILGGTGWPGGGVLAAFFVSSSVVSHLAPRWEQLDAKGSRRDSAQVLANGGVAALAALLGRSEPALGLWLVTTALAAAAADTWATSIGAWSRTPPRLILDGRPVSPGTSGGITPAGCAGAALGAFAVAAAGAAAGREPMLLPAAGLIGFLGMALDSALGAALQGRFRCPACDLPSEWPVHRCGTATLHEGGLPWLNNDAVNLVATAGAAALGWASWSWLSP